MKNFYPSRHAVSSMSARDITWEDVLHVLDEPEVTYRNSHGPHAGKNTEVHQRGPLYVVVALDPTFDPRDTGNEHPLYAVVTVGLRTVKVWDNDDAKNRRT